MHRVRLPPGFRFHPTDAELVVQYLKRKVQSYPLPASIIPEVDVCKSDPWDLPGVSEQEESYFFSTREVKYPNGNGSNRATGSGYWKATGLDKQITHQDQIVGMKKTLVFYTGKPPKGLRTDWIMHEYRLNPSSQGPQEPSWVLCRIFLKRRNNNSKSRSCKIDEEEAGATLENKRGSRSGPVFYDFLGKDLNRVPANSASGSSGITEDNEESSCCNSFYHITGLN